MSIKIGITGGIGSGKSVVSRLFGIMGIPVYISDIEAKNDSTHHFETHPDRPAHKVPDKSPDLSA